MTRHGYSEDQDNWEFIRWRGRVASATRGKRGQKLLRDLLEALDAMPERRLIRGDLQHEGEVCALGALGVRRGIPLAEIDPDDYEHVSAVFDVAEPLVREIEFENDEWASRGETPEERWVRMRAWVAGQIKEETTDEQR